jgi:hypothetical protein
VERIKYQQKIQIDVCINRSRIAASDPLRSSDEVLNLNDTIMTGDRMMTGPQAVDCILFLVNAVSTYTVSRYQSPVAV